MITKKTIVDMGYVEDNWMKAAVKAVNSQSWDTNHPMYWTNVRALVAFFHDGGQMVIDDFLDSLDSCGPVDTIDDGNYDNMDDGA